MDGVQDHSMVMLMHSFGLRYVMLYYVIMMLYYVNVVFLMYLLYYVMIMLVLSNVILYI